MELFIELQDHEDYVHDEFKLKFDSQKTLDDLEEKITSKWKIESVDQKLFNKDGQKLYGRGAKSLEFYGLKDGDTVIVKHANLPHWVEMTAYAEEALQAKSVNNIGRFISSVEAALPYFKLLISNNFFKLYPRFVPKLRSFEGDFVIKVECYRA